MPARTAYDAPRAVRDFDAIAGAMGVDLAPFDNHNVDVDAPRSQPTPPVLPTPPPRQPYTHRPSTADVGGVVVCAHPKTGVKKGAFQRMTMRVKASPTMGARGFKPWQNSVALVGKHAKEWREQDVDRAAEAQDFSSVIIASEVILRQIYTETGRGAEGGDAVGGPHRRRTAVAVVLLYNVVQRFGKYKDLTMCLLRDLLESIYKSVEDDPSVLWTALTAPPGERFFTERAQYLADTFLERPTYFDECREVGTAYRKTRARLSQLHADRGTHNATIDRLLHQRDRALCRRVLSWWWTYVRLEKLLLRTSKRALGQLRLFAKRYARAHRLQTLGRVFSAIQQEAFRGRRARYRAATQEAEIEKGELQLKFNEASTTEERYRACLSLWEKWCDGVIGVQESWDPQPQRTQRYRNDYVASYKRRFEKMTTLIKQGLLASENKIPQALPPVRDEVMMQLGLRTLTQQESHTLNYVRQTYYTTFRGDMGMSVFDIMRFLRDVGISGDRERGAVLDVFGRHAQAHGNEAGLWVPLDEVEELFVRVALADAQLEPMTPGTATRGPLTPTSPTSQFSSSDTTPVSRFIDHKITAKLDVMTKAEPLDEFLSTPQMFESFVKYGRVVMMYSMKTARTRPEEYIESLYLPNLTRQTIATVFKDVRAGRKQLHKCDWLVVAAALAQCHDPFPFRAPHDKFITFFRLLMETEPKRR